MKETGLSAWEMRFIYRENASIKETKMNPGRELDALVAEKVFGRRVSWEDSGEEDGKDDCYILNDQGEWSYSRFVPHYSTDIAAAWEVVEKIKAMRIDIANFFLEWGGQRWFAGYIEYEQYDSPAFDGCEALDAPHAICLAALKAVGVEVE